MPLLTPRGYTSKSEVEGILGATIVEPFAGALDDLMAKGEDWVDRVCRRRFDQYVVLAAAPLRVETYGGQLQRIPDTVSLTSALLDDYSGQPDSLGTAGVDYRLEPSIAPSQLRPYTRIRLVGGLRYGYRGSRIASSFPDTAELLLAGTFGWPAIPPSIRHATGLLVVAATQLWRGATAGSVSKETIGDYSVEYATSFADTATQESWRRPLVRLIRP